jgi:flagellar M-ring protein FliF
MDQLKKFFRSLSVRQRISMAAAVVLVIGAIIGFLHWNQDRNYKPLYSNLSAEDSGAVLAKLRESGVEYRIRDADSAILVPSEKIAELRLQMATAGIPKSGRIGYELFDKTNFGATDFTEQINYHRAVEGELERSVQAMAEVDQARVHVSFPKDSVFTDDKQPAKASVMVKLKMGAKLSEQKAAAIAQLASSAVEGLTPESVSVMDMQGNLLIRPKKPGDGSEPSEGVLEYKDKMERETLAKINSELDPLLGSSKYRASVAIDCDLTSGEQSEELFDPTHSVITSSQKSEEGSTAKAEAPSVPGTQANLPRPPVRTPVQGGGVARRTENMSYETNRTVRRLKLPQGIIKRMSISLLVDHNLRWEMAGKGAAARPKRIIEPPTPERMKTIQSIVAAATGFNPARGDQLTVETLPFESTINAEPPTSMLPATPSKAPEKPSKFSPVMIGSAVGGVVVLALVAFFFLRSRKAKARQAEIEAELESARNREIAEAESAETSDETTVSEVAEGEKIPGLEAPKPFTLAPPMTTKADVLTKHIAAEAQKDPAALARIIRSWLNEAKT